MQLLTGAPPRSRDDNEGLAYAADPPIESLEQTLGRKRTKDERCYPIVIAGMLVSA